MDGKTTDIVFGPIGSDRLERAVREVFVAIDTLVILAEEKQHK